MELVKQKSIPEKKRLLPLCELEYRKQVHQAAGKRFCLRGIEVSTINS